jgi:hypothetical protein
MLTAFFRTGITDICANTADVFCLVAAKAHQLRSSIANGRTFHVKLNAFFHHINILLLKAGGSTVIANSGAFEARINALLKFVVTHGNNFRVIEVRKKRMPAMAWQIKQSKKDCLW